MSVAKLSHFLTCVGIILQLNLTQAVSCTTKEHTPGECKLLEDCPVIIDLIQKKESNYKICSHSPLTVCCPVEVISLSGIQLENKSLKRRKHEIKCSEYSEYVYEQARSLSLKINSKPKRTNKCGNRDTALIVGGEKAKAREFPHMAAVGYLHMNKIKWNCGGSLISDEYVLTAAHCLDTEKFGLARYVRLGDLDLKTHQDDADQEDFNVIERIAHPSYNKTIKYNDIGLLKLHQKVDLNPYKRPICLPSSFDSVTERVIVSGWGLTQYNTHNDPGALLRVVLEKFNNTVCNSVYTHLTLNTESRAALEQGIDSKTQVCAGSYHESKDACQGDSGGPMQVYHHSEYCMYTVVGVTSFGFLCGIRGIPGVYTRVYPYIDWIESIVWN